MTVKFDSFQDMCQHMQGGCEAFNHVFEVKPKQQESVMPSEKEIEAHINNQQKGDGR